MYAIMNVPPEPPSAVNLRVPARLDALILKALEKDPDLRYQSARELGVDLDRLGAPTATAPRPRPRRGGLARVPAWALAAAGLIAVLSVLWVVNPAGWRDRMRESATGPGNSLAVLPLANLSGDAQQEYFADGMTEELITSLTKISALMVISMSSVKEFKGQNRPMKEIGRALHVAMVLRGSVMRSADRVRINAQLIEAATNRNVWAESYERELSDVIALQSEVALAIAREIQVKLTPQEKASLAATRAVDPRAHQAYLLGRFELGHLTEAAAQRAIGHFERAIKIDSGYAVAYAALAEGYYFLNNVVLPPDQAMPLMRASALKALELDGDLAMAHTMLALVVVAYEFKWAEADSSFRRAIRLNPGDATAHHWYGYWLMPRGRFAEAERELQKALELDPLTAGTQWHAAWPSFYRGDYPQTVAALEALRAKNLADMSTYSLLGESYEQMGRFDEAITQLRKSLELGGHPWVLAAIGRVHARAGRRDSALVVLAQLEALSRGTYVTPYGVASVYAALGDKDRAFGLLERAYSERSEDLVLMKIDPRLEPLRADPRFAAMLERIGLGGS